MTSTPATRTPSIDREDGSHITPTNKERDNDASLVSSSRASTAAEPPHHHGGPPLGRARTIGTITACTLVMMNNMGNGPSFTVTLPDLAKDLGITPANIQWVISAYSLTAVCRFALPLIFASLPLFLLRWRVFGFPKHFFSCAVHLAIPELVRLWVIRVMATPAIERASGTP